MLEIKSRLSI